MSYFVLRQLIFALILTRIACKGYQAKESYPFLVKIEAKGKILKCAGTILTPCTVLTSAHCVEGVEPAEITVSQISSSKITKYKVVATAVHPKYKSAVLANEIALLRTEKNFQPPWAAVRLNSPCCKNIFQECNYYQILGWSDEIMKEPIRNEFFSGFKETPTRTSVKLIPNENCSVLIKNFGGIFEGEEKLCGITTEEDGSGCFTGPGGPLLCSLNSQGPKEKMSSARATDIQQMDLINKNGILAEPIDLLENLMKSEELKLKRGVQNDVNNLQVGVISWGKSCSRVPSVYIRIDSYYSWINRTTLEMTAQCPFGFGNFSFVTPLKARASRVSLFSVLEISICLIFIRLLFRLL